MNLPARPRQIMVSGLDGALLPGVSVRPAYSSTSVAWNGFLLERHNQLPPEALAPSIADAYILGIPLTATPPSSIVWHIDGQRVCGHMTPEHVYLRDTGEEFACAWTAPLDIIFLSIEPQSIAWACDMLRVKGAHMLRTHLANAQPRGKDRQSPGMDQRLRELILALDAHVRGAGENGSLYEETLLLACGLEMVHLYRADGYAYQPPARADALPARKLRTALEFISEHLTQPLLTLQAIANSVHLSAYHLSRQFRKSLSVPVWQYVQHCRIAYACRLMARHPDMPLAIVAEASGFNSYTSFFSAFRKIRGAAPLRTRNRLKPGFG
jgi:AraC-like DNA-binding protein